MPNQIFCSCGCGRLVPQNRNSTIKNKLHPNCQLKAAMKKTKVKQSTFATGKKKAGKSNLDKQLDDAWSLLVKLIAGNKCEYCGNRQSLNSHHIFSRIKKSVRWNTRNGIALCVNHHIGSDFSAHKSGTDFTMWLIRYRGEKEIQELSMLSNSTSHYSEFEKELILNDLRMRINELKSK